VSDRPLPDHYAVLQVVPEADPEVIQAAYRRLAQKYHPDTAGPESVERMSAINAAWEVLGDPELRAAYDRQRRRAARAAATTPPWAPAPASPPGAAATPTDAPPDQPSPHWTSGRSSHGSGYDPASMRAPEGHGAAGPPPGDPAGSVLTFGRYARWSLGEIARRDLEYLEWLERMPIGRPYREEIDQLLRRAGHRRSAEREPSRRGLFRRG